MQNRKMMCVVYGSKRHSEMYLYLPKAVRLDSLPPELLARFGPPRRIMELLLTPNTVLARVDAQRVFASMDERGFYLQMPPAEKENWFADYRKEAFRDDSQ